LLLTTHGRLWTSPVVLNLLRASAEAIWQETWNNPVEIREVS